MASFWRSGDDRMLERVVISRRTSEQELDLLLLLEEDAPEAEQARAMPPRDALPEPLGEASAGELATAVAEWLAKGDERLAWRGARLGHVVQHELEQLEQRPRLVSLL